MEEIKKVWTKWEIVEKIGEGGFGEVYKAKREILGEITWSAIKVVRIPHNLSEVKEMETSGLTEDLIKDYYKQSVNNYINEIKTMDTMKSASHIVGIEDYEVVENEQGIGWTIYIRMELLTNLNDYIKSNPLTVKDVIHLGTELLTGLEFCHRKNIIHRDIKPANIFISSFGEYKLGDFGISKEVERTNATLSQKGTKSYMAPEMINGRKYGKDVDMYALGLTMYELLNHGRMPFLPPYPQPFYPQDRDEAIFRRLSGEVFPDIEGIGELNEILKKACDKDPTKRYQSASEMKKALEQLADSIKEDIDYSEKKQSIFNTKDEKYIEKVVEYVLQEFYKKEGIHLTRELAIDRVYGAVKKQLSLSKTYPIVIDIPDIVKMDDGLKSLYVQINSINEIEDALKKTPKDIDDHTEKTQNIFSEEEKKPVQDKPKENNSHDVEYEQKVIEYVLQEFYKKENVDLRDDTLAVSRIRAEVSKQLSLSKDYPIIIDIPHIIVTNDGPKSLYVQVSSNIEIKQNVNKTQDTNEQDNKNIEKTENVFQKEKDDTERALNDKKEDNIGKQSFQKKEKRHREMHEFIIVFVIVILGISIAIYGLYEVGINGDSFKGDSFQEGIDKGYDDGTLDGTLQVALQYVNQNQDELETFFKDELLMENVEFDEYYYIDADISIVSYDVYSSSNDFDLNISFYFDSQGVIEEEMTIDWYNEGSIRENPISLDLQKMEKIKERFDFDVITTVNEYKTKLEKEDDSEDYEFSQYDENNDIYLNESNDYWVYLSVSKYHE